MKAERESSLEYPLNETRYKPDLRGYHEGSLPRNFERSICPLVFQHGGRTSIRKHNSDFLHGEMQVVTTTITQGSLLENWSLQQPGIEHSVQ
jgi:hypothetical protein